MSNLLSAIGKSEQQLKDLKEEYEENAKQIQIKMLLQVRKTFVNIGWDSWSEKQFIEKGQYERLLRAFSDKKMKITSAANCAGNVKSSSEYYVSKNGCSCGDYAYRKLPCKHMFFFAINYCEDFGTISEKDSIDSFLPNNDFKTTTFVITGEFENISREDLKKYIESLGGRVAGSVSGKTDYLILGKDAGNSKLEKAKKLNVTIISYEEFTELISKNSPPIKQ